MVVVACERFVIDDKKQRNDLHPSAGTVLGAVEYPKGGELFVLDGEFEDSEGTYTKGAWLRIPAGGSHAPATKSGCTVYIKRGGLPYLLSS